ncbi:putative ATP-dependent endonuclease of the OLD family [Bradyrhizobium sp. Rc2d]|uniref:ATP-dependent nuclease n=1 Tax=Bradyrhizobium sp. Rc2d TaxID=1855321 RepID=UPI00088AF8C9|nr:AAA family ATPase [Bradyrhizobium sp. Rc2d]SDH54125.1 putative ATP-dependent endonuclease of the OLD family [Bradyrhizobium sp. Rc2d]
MYISLISIENFRNFGSGSNAFVLPLKPGFTAIVGENDAGKTAVIDALRLVLGTRDQEYMRVESSDFHYLPGGQQTDQISIRLTFSSLSVQDRAAFAEYLTYAKGGVGNETQLIVTWVAKRNSNNSTRRVRPAELRAGATGDGPLLDSVARALLTATYLRPLRDAERAMSAGRGSRLSQILQHTKEIRDTGIAFDPKADPPIDPRKLSVLGVGDYASFLFGESDGIRQARDKLNFEFLNPLSFANDLLNARIAVSSAQDDTSRLRQMLEKLELELGEGDVAHMRGLGSNNLLFMACELLLLAAEMDGFPLLLIEEPEAHLHPQRQLRLMSFLQTQADKIRADGQQIQIIVTTHSPNLASELRLENVALIEGGKAFPMGSEHTKLSRSDYRFLERFLDVTKANLFFARAVMIVEGDAETILLPIIAKLIGRDFGRYGVSLVNVGGVGLSRYARIFMRANPGVAGGINTPVACITDMDVMPDAAPWIVGKLKQGEDIPPLKVRGRQWRVKADFPGARLEERRQQRRMKASEQAVETFVADQWTLEFDLAYYGLRLAVWFAAHFALADNKLVDGRATKKDVALACSSEFFSLVKQDLSSEVFAAHVYSKFEKDAASKTVAAQYLAEHLENLIAKGRMDAVSLLKRLPPYRTRVGQLTDISISSRRPLSKKSNPTAARYDQQ